MRPFCRHWGAVGGGFQADLEEEISVSSPAQREEQPELRQFSLFALPCHRNVAAACTVDGKLNGQRLPARQGVDGTNCDKFSLYFSSQGIAPGIETGGLPEGNPKGAPGAALVVAGGRTP